MSRNGTGTMSIPNILVPGTPISASDHNENYSDIASELTNSVAVDGQSTMTGPLKASSGTVGAPGITFGADTDSGLYRVGSNDLGIAVGGALVAEISSTGMSVTGTVSASGAVKQSGFAVRPIGEITLYGGSSAPSGFLLCNGASLLRASYPDLFAIIGTTYGSADGTHFNVPDLTGRVAAGKEASATRLTASYFGGDSTALGATGGVEKITMAQANLPNTTLGVTGSLTVTTTRSDVVVGNFVSVGSVGTGGTVNVISQSTGSPGSTTVTSTGSLASGVTASINGGVAQTLMNNVQPTLILNYIIFAGV